jgi:CubicO group peptidase (beta-lactamase class C family)
MHPALNITLALVVAGLLMGQEPGAMSSQGTVPVEPVAHAPHKSPRLGGNDINKELGVFLDQLAVSDSFSGAVLIAKDEEPVFRKAYGMANKNGNVQNQVATKFNLGSMNKMFTGVAIAQLAEQGKLSFNDTVGKYLPNYPNKAVAGKVTIHQLLTHTSGLGDYFNEKFSAAQSDFRRVADYLPVFANDPLAFEPGQGWKYSNAGYIVLGAIIERVTGQSYYDYVQKQIFKPAGMSHTGFYPPVGDLPGAATPYTNVGPKGLGQGPRHAAERVELRGGPAGGGYSTVDDLLKFSIALRRHKLLSPQYTDLVTTGKVDAPFGKYGYGFGVVNFNGVRSFGHNGGAPGISAQFDVYPDLGYTVIVLSNYDPPAMVKVLSKIRTLIV